MTYIESDRHNDYPRRERTDGMEDRPTEDETTCQCSACGDSFADEGELRDHVKSVGLVY
ncbi:hypothetical protein SAMN04488124_2290 [Halogeometricum limi]|uniref:C2H2-type domain-containing protein n=1 Tax=Halogeometricum limi TaxID=555875 RepID=A0A1I6HIJ3_9EURY|nr:hypothetical protein SAMN04488124_2290 [Halogeometricum limi]